MVMLLLLLLLLLLLVVLLAMLLAISGPGKAGGICRRLINKPCRQCKISDTYTGLVVSTPQGKLWKKVNLGIFPPIFGRQFTSKGRFQQFFKARQKKKRHDVQSLSSWSSEVNRLKPRGLQRFWRSWSETESAEMVGWLGGSNFLGEVRLLNVDG